VTAPLLFGLELECCAFAVERFANSFASVVSPVCIEFSLLFEHGVHSPWRGVRWTPVVSLRIAPLLVFLSGVDTNRWFANNTEIVLDAKLA
jgi:hypothetical protein